MAGARLAQVLLIQRQLLHYLKYTILFQSWNRLEFICRRSIVGALSEGGRWWADFFIVKHGTDYGLGELCWYFTGKPLPLDPSSQVANPLFPQQHVENDAGGDKVTHNASQKSSRHAACVTAMPNGFCLVFFHLVIEVCSLFSTYRSTSRLGGQLLYLWSSFPRPS
jgi:hypothetical protein